MYDKIMYELDGFIKDYKAQLRRCESDEAALMIKGAIGGLQLAKHVVKSMKGQKETTQLLENLLKEKAIREQMDNEK